MRKLFCDLSYALRFWQHQKMKVWAWVHPTMVIPLKGRADFQSNAGNFSFWEEKRR